MIADKALTDAEKRTRVSFVSTAFVLLSIIIAQVYLATGTSTAATATRSFAGGVSNIFRPCTLPLAFVIVPMSMGQGYRPPAAITAKPVDWAAHCSLRRLPGNTVP